MADYFSKNTLRVRLKYRTPYDTHYLLLRYQQGTTLDGARIKAQTFCSAIAPSIAANVSFVEARIALKGENVFKPVEWTTVPGSASFDLGPGNPRGYYVEFGGRSLGDSEARWYIFGTAQFFNSAMQFNVVQVAQYANIWSALSDAGQGFVAIDGSTVRPRGYVNVGINDEITRQARGG